jgi:hypothetical protein
LLAYRARKRAQCLPVHFQLGILPSTFREREGNGLPAVFVKVLAAPNLPENNRFASHEAVQAPILALLHALRR